MSEGHVRFEISERVATLVLDRPEALNAFFGTMREELLAAIDQGARAARALVVTGAGRGFSSGGDLSYMASLRRRNDGEELGRLVAAGRRIIERLQELPIPTLAAVNGVAAGAGLGLALACDLRMASDTARFGATFSRVGLHPDWGVSYFLPRLVGPAFAGEMIFTGRMCDAAEALRIGLVNRVVPAAELSARSREWAREIAAMPETSLRWAKTAIDRAPGASLKEMLDYEEEAQRACFASEDALEGLSAFEEKRAPRFGGKGPAHG